MFTSPIFYIFSCDFLHICGFSFSHAVKKEVICLSTLEKRLYRQSHPRAASAPRRPAACNPSPSANWTAPWRKAVPACRSCLKSSPCPHPRRARRLSCPMAGESCRRRSNTLMAQRSRRFYPTDGKARQRRIAFILSMARCQYDSWNRKMLVHMR